MYIKKNNTKPYLPNGDKTHRSGVGADAETHQTDHQSQTLLFIKQTHALFIDRTKEISLRKDMDILRLKSEKLLLEQVIVGFNVAGAQVSKTFGKE